MANYRFKTFGTVPSFVSFTFVEPISKIAAKIAAEYEYKYDPQHKNRPEGNWNETSEGWSTSGGWDHTKQLTVSPQITSPKNDPVRSLKNLNHFNKMAQGIIHSVSRNATFKIVGVKNGRYNDLQTGVLSKEPSFTIDIEEISNAEAVEIGRRMCHDANFKQQSVLLWDKDAKTSQLICRNTKNDLGDIYTLDPVAAEFFLDETSPDVDVKTEIDNVMKQEGVVGWTIGKFKGNIVGTNQGVVPVSEQILIHGLKDLQKIEEISKALAKQFKKSVAARDMNSFDMPKIYNP